MSYYLGDAYDVWKTTPPEYEEEKEISLEDKRDAILESILTDDVLFLRVEEEVYDKRFSELSLLHFKAYNGVDIRKDLDKLFEEVVELCLKEHINYFGE